MEGGGGGARRVTQCACLVFNFILGLPKWGWLGACVEGCRHSVSCQDQLLSITPPLMSPFNLQSGRRSFQSARWGPSTDDASRRQEQSSPLNHPANHTVPEEKAVIVTSCLAPEEKTVIVTYGRASSRAAGEVPIQTVETRGVTELQTNNFPMTNNKLKNKSTAVVQFESPQGSREATNKALFSPET